jgi:Na+/proline symporter
MKFGIKTRVVFSSIYVLLTMFAAVCQVVGLGITLAALTGIPYSVSTWICGAIYISYIFLGGIWATAVNSFIQAIICAVGMTALVIYIFYAYGDYHSFSNLPPELASFPGKMGWGPLVFFSFGGLLWGWVCAIFPQQYYYNNAVGSRTEKHAVKGFVVAGIIAAIFFAWTLPTVGIYARDILPNLAFGGEAAFGEIIKLLPIGLNGFVLLVVLAGAMSTACPQILGTANLATREFYLRLINPKATEKQIVNVSRVLTLVFGVVIIIIGSIFTGSSSTMLGIFFSLSSPLLATTVSLIFWTKATKEGCVVSVICGSIAAVFWIFFGKASIMHASWVGAIVSVPILIVVTLITQKKGWWKEIQKTILDSESKKNEMLVLENIRMGRHTQDKILDMLGGDSVIFGQVINKLIDNGYVERLGKTYHKSLVFMLTDKGKAALPALSEQEEGLLQRTGIGNQDFEIIKAIGWMEKKKIGFISVVALAEKVANVVSSDLLSPILVALVDKEYIIEKGLFRTSFFLTKKSWEILSTEKAGWENQGGI